MNPIIMSSGATGAVARSGERFRGESIKGGKVFARRTGGDDAVILAIDQGTTGTTVLLINRAGLIVGRGYREIPCRYPRPGWVEQDAVVLWQRSLEAIAEARRAAPGRAIAAIGIANQRETTVLWDVRTGAPIAPAIVWQCRRTAARCAQLRANGWEGEISRRTGLVIDPYFSATKIAWILDTEPSLREGARRGDIRFGTIDSWLIWNLSGGQIHRTDYSNASRTMLYNLDDRVWDPVLLEMLDIPAPMLPEVTPSSFIQTESTSIALPDGTSLPSGLPIAGVAGDQQAALFGQAAYEPGMVKCTYGTGAFLLMNTGPESLRSSGGLLTTLACGEGSEPPYALEGSIFIAGAAVQWLRDQLGIIASAAETEDLAAQVSDTAGVYFVPAFVGLGAPYWDAEARGGLIGLTRGADRAHIVRATLEAIAYQTRDVLEVMAADAGRPPSEIRIDGGAAANNFLAQFLADATGISVVRPRILETTALGAAYLAGLATGFWASTQEIARLWEADRQFEPRLGLDRRDELYAGWRKAVERVRR